MSDLMVLTKARLSLLVIITTFVGFCMASGPHLDWLLLFHAVLGTTLAAAAAAVLNQFLEANVDRLMERTRHRPLPAGRMKPGTALALGIAHGRRRRRLALAGGECASAPRSPPRPSSSTSPLYTPLKRRTSLCTIVGAVSGAIPPVIGWTAVRPSFDLGAWVLFGILFTWQMPHFLAIAWMYRDEYAQAGFVMLRRDDLSGCATAMQSLLYTVALIVITLVPFFAGLNSGIYLAGALLLDARHAALAPCSSSSSATAPAPAGFSSPRSSSCPLILGLMVFTKV